MTTKRLRFTGDSVALAPTRRYTTDARRFGRDADRDSGDMRDLRTAAERAGIRDDETMLGFFHGDRGYRLATYNGATFLFGPPGSGGQLTEDPQYGTRAGGSANRPLPTPTTRDAAIRAELAAAKHGSGMSFRDMRPSLNRGGALSRMQRSIERSRATRDAQAVDGSGTETRLARDLRPEDGAPREEWLRDPLRNVAREIR